MILIIPKVKSFFQKTPDAMQRMLNKISTKEDDEDLEEEKIEEMHKLKAMEYSDTLQDYLE